MGLPSGRVAGGSTRNAARRLFGIYALVSVVPVLLLGACLLALTHRQATIRGLAEGANEADLVARSAIAPQLGDHPLSDGLTPAETQALRRTANLSARSGDVLRLRVRDLAGRVVFSPDGAGMGKIWGTTLVTGNIAASVQERLGFLGVEPQTMSADEFNALLRADWETSGAVVKASGARIE